MNTLLAIDDGLTNANYNAADVCFVIAALLGLIAAILALTFPNPPSKWSAPAAYLAIGLIAFSFFLL